MGDKSDEQAQKQAEDNIEIWKIKKLIKSLEAARGCAAAAAATAAATAAAAAVAAVAAAADVTARWLTTSSLSLPLSLLSRPLSLLSRPRPPPSSLANRCCHRRSCCRRRYCCCRRYGRRRSCCRRRLRPHSLETLGIPRACPAAARTLSREHRLPATRAQPPVSSAWCRRRRHRAVHVLRCTVDERRRVRAKAKALACSPADSRRARPVARAAGTARA